MVNAGLRANCSGNTVGRESHHDSHSCFSHLQDGATDFPDSSQGAQNGLYQRKHSLISGRRMRKEARNRVGARGKDPSDLMSVQSFDFFA